VTVLGRVLGSSNDRDCGCDVAFEGDRLVVGADDCPAEGRLAESPACRETVVGALTRRDTERVVVRRRGVERTYADAATALLVAAGRFAEAVGFYEERLATVTRRDPLRAAREATARAGPVSDLAAETGLATVADRAGATGAAGVDDYGTALPSTAVPAVARMRVQAPPRDASLQNVRELETDAIVRLYDVADGRRYQLRPAELDLSEDALATLMTARERLADGDRSRPQADRAPERAVRAVADPDEPVLALARTLHKHTRGYGVLRDFFADPRITDVYATAPVGETPLRAVVDGTELPTNVSLTPDGARTLASRLRRESGRAFSRATPTLDATATLPTGRIRVAGVTDPVSDGVAFAFRDHGQTAWTLPGLVDNGTMTIGAAALLSVAVERDAATLVAGARGAGKTATLAALLWELPRTTRTLVIEDTPELPVEALRTAGRDVQALWTTTNGDDEPGIDPAEALRTGLRMGNSALVVGEVRGEEANVLYEAMRVGASDDAVLGTIHGEGADAVRERVTSDLGVPESSFAATDLVVSIAVVETPTGRTRRIRAIEEVIPAESGVRFAPLYELDGRELVSTGRVERGDSHLVAGLARPGESYGQLRATLEDRSTAFERLVDRGRTRPTELRDAYTGREPSSGTGAARTTTPSAERDRS